MLYIVGTPIGNLSDISQRGLETLRSVDVVIAESVADARKLLNAYDIKGKRVEKYNDRNKRTATQKIIELLKTFDAAYISSAGTPGISDPGTDLVRAARDKGITVRAIPGPSALTALLSVSGIRARQFTFLSFPPKKQGKLKKLFEEYKQREEVMIFFESTHRIVKTLNLLNDVSPDVHVFVGKEITKMFETYFEGTPSEVVAQLEKSPKNIKGEFSVIVDFSL